MRILLMAVCLVSMAACREDLPTGPSYGLDERFTLAPAQSATVESVAFTFVDVQGDSRCPADAICIQGGDAVVRVRATSGSTTQNLELHTGDTSRASAVVGPLRVELVELQPYPFASRPTPPGDYRATLVVTRP